ncbi:hypothetical protein, partial [Rivihabitans pingtungensis]
MAEMKVIHCKKQGFFAVLIINLGPLLFILTPLLIEICWKITHIWRSLFFIFLYFYLHDYLAARSIEECRRVGGGTASDQILRVALIIGEAVDFIVRIAKFALAYIVIPVVAYLAHSAFYREIHPALISLILLCIFTISLDVARIVKIIKRLLFDKEEEYANTFEAITFSYLSLIISYSILYMSMHRIGNGYFSGNLGAWSCIDFIYFNTITFTTLEPVLNYPIAVKSKPHGKPQTLPIRCQRRRMG